MKYAVGEYTESLKSGGELRVSLGFWEIHYYFPGPDLRYRGEFLTINNRDIDKYISAWTHNFKEYLKIKERVDMISKITKNHGYYTSKGEADMIIRVGTYPEGVSLKNRHITISQQKELDEIMADYNYAKRRAETIQNMLKNMEECARV